MLSVLMAVYKREKPEFLASCLESIASQTLKADQVVVVKDGPLTPELEEVLARFAERLPLITPALPTNKGTGEAVQLGMRYCTGDLIARADSDDILHLKRFEKQVHFLEEHPEIDIVSAAGAEFESDPEKPFCVKRAPVSGRRLNWYAKFRNPISHQAATMFRRAQAVEAGGYQSCLLFEDYDLWARMMMNGSQVFNMPEVLAYIRCGDGMLGRRRGMKYIRSEIEFLRKMYRIGFLTRFYFVANLALRIPCRLLPQKWLKRFYYLFLRRAVPQQ